MRRFSSLVLVSVSVAFAAVLGGCSSFGVGPTAWEDDRFELPASDVAQTAPPTVVRRRVVSLNDAVTWAAQTAADAKAKADALEADALAKGDTKTAQQAQTISGVAGQVGTVAGQVADATRPDPQTGQVDYAKAGGAIGAIWGPVGALAGTAIGGLLTGLIGGHQVGWRRRGTVWTTPDIQEAREIGLTSKPAQA